MRAVHSYRLVTICGLFGFFLFVGQAQAQLQFKATTVDAGTAYRGASLTGRFEFTVGQEPVHVLGARGSCGCARPTLAARVYQPGERGQVVLNVKTLSQAAGPQAWTAHVAVRTGQKDEEIALTLTAQLIAEIQVEPATMVVTAERLKEHQIVVTDVRQPPMNVQGVRTSSSHLRARLEKTGAGRWKIELDLAEGYPEGKREERVEIVTDDVRYETLEVPVTILKRVPQLVSATPKEADVTLAAGSRSASRLVVLSAAEGQPLEIDRIESDHPAVTTRWAKGPGERVTLRIMVDAERVAEGKLRASVHVHCLKPAGAVVTVPVSVR